ncbi:MAG: ferrochelatase [Planctomyces sp.]|nr:ferrochelatase [Planctomyces sp.]
MTARYDALLFVSFGGPEKRDDVIPFLENVLRGKPVPRERMLEVAEHYYHFDGVSPINQQCRDLIAALSDELRTSGIELPIYWGNRNWDPLLPATIRKMKDDGIRSPLVYITSGFSCYSGCRQYRENVMAAIAEVGATEMVPGKIRVFYNHPDFIEVLAELVGNQVSLLSSNDGGFPHIAFTAHSIPMSMARTSDYEKQLRETCTLVAQRLNLPESNWKLVYQSRSGRPQDPWLEPDICDYLKSLHASGVRNVVISPVGFLSDHMEVLYDLDDEAAKVCSSLGLKMLRAATPGNHSTFVRMIRKLIEERIKDAPRECVGQFGPNHDVCPTDCCPAPMPPAARPTKVEST